MLPDENNKEEEVNTEKTPYKLTDYDLHYERVTDRRTALEQAVKACSSKTEFLGTDFIIEVADKFFDWLQK